MNSCFAVGVDALGEVLIAQWNGTSWSSATVPAATGGNLFGKLEGVTCRTSASCFAVGEQNGVSGSMSLVEQWNGSSWLTMASANPVNPDPTSFRVDTSLAGVSCPAPASCFAVGTADTYAVDFSTQTDTTVIEHWNGTAWALSTSPKVAGNPFGDPAFLSGVSCAAPNSCVAVGDNPSGPLVEHWNGSRWSLGSIPLSFGAASVSCLSTKSCYAVGTGGTKSAAHWNGARWSALATPSPAGTTFLFFLGLACPTATSCTAVGGYNIGSVTKTLVERYA